MECDSEWHRRDSVLRLLRVVRDDRPVDLPPGRKQILRDLKLLFRMDMGASRALRTPSQSFAPPLSNR